MIKYFLDEMKREADELVDRLMIECDLMEFKNEEDLLWWADDIADKHGDILTMDSYIYIIDYAMDKLEGYWGGS